MIGQDDDLARAGVTFGALWSLWSGRTLWPCRTLWPGRALLVPGEGGLLGRAALGGVCRGVGDAELAAVLVVAAVDDAVAVRDGGVGSGADGEGRDRGVDGDGDELGSGLSISFALVVSRQG